jgi:hypothetical protein
MMDMKPPMTEVKIVRLLLPSGTHQIFLRPQLLIVRRVMSQPTVNWRTNMRGKHEFRLNCVHRQLPLLGDIP